MIVLGDQPLGAVLRRVADLAAAGIPRADHVSITLIEDGHARSAAFTDPVAAALDERQYEVGFGPCLDAASTGETVRVPSTQIDADELYGEFTVAARRVGVRSSVSVGLPLPQRVVGSLNIFTTGPEALTDDDVGVAEQFSGYAAVALANASLYDSTAKLAADMKAAMASRAVIEQAKGVLMARTGCTSEQAFTRLSRMSQEHNTKLREVAEHLVADAQHPARGVQ